MAELSNTFAVFCAYSQERIERHATDYSHLMHVLASAGMKHLIAVFNRPAARTPFARLRTPASMAITQIDGSNRQAEFSAWLEGIAAYRENIAIDEPAGVILFNDTLFSHFSFSPSQYITFQTGVCEAKKKEVPAIAGLHHRLPAPGRVLDRACREWIQTALYFLNHSAIKVFEECTPVALDSYPDEGIDSLGSSYELLRVFFDEQLAYHVGRWLFAGGWRYSTASTDFDPALLRTKLLSIVAEKYLSASIQAKGGVLCPVDLMQYFSRTATASRLMTTRWDIRASLLRWWISQRHGES